jgi:ATP-dependent protease ClpP protease subunit
MVHKTTVTGASGGQQEMKNEAEELRVEADWYFSLLEARTKTTRAQWEDLCKVETCFGAQVALDLGLVDEIL